MKKNLVSKKGITLMSLITIIAVLAAICFILENKFYIENIVLTKENFEETMKEYAEKQKENDDFSDDYYYVLYAEIYHMFKDGFSAGFGEALTTGKVSDDTCYKGIYGKTIKELKEEGKSLMKQNNVSVNDYKNVLKDNNDNVSSENVL